MKSQFTGDGITIRPYLPDDVSPLFEAVRESITDLAAWLPWCQPGYSIKDSEAFVSTRAAEWEKGAHYSFVIADAVTDRFLGGVGLNFFNQIHGFANLGYWVRTSATRCGVATAAVRLAARFGLEQLHLGRIEIVVAVGNQPSQRVAEKASARREGVLRRRLFLNKTFHDAVMFSFIPEDFGLRFPA